jgi:hypothetical protein
VSFRPDVSRLKHAIVTLYRYLVGTLTDRPPVGLKDSVMDLRRGHVHDDGDAGQLCMPSGLILCEWDEMWPVSAARRLFAVKLRSVKPSGIPEFLIRCYNICSRYNIVKHVTNGSTHMTDQICNGSFDVQFVFC